MRLGRWKCLGVVGATPPLWIPAFAGMTNSVAGTIHFRTNEISTEEKLCSMSFGFPNHRCRQHNF